jgi:GntR family transcriptional repressor for pyruvate dehydrogenase complex
MTGVLNRQPMSVQIAERIIEEISDGRYPPGASLPSEQQLAEDYGVSRPIVREALKFLSAQGFVTVTTGRGATIRGVDNELLRVFMRRVLAAGSKKDTLDLFELRIALEKLSAAKAARSRERRDLADMKRTVERMGEFLGQTGIYAEFDMKFHVELARASHDVFLFHLISSIREILVSVSTKMRGELSRAELPFIHSQHLKILNAVERQDPTTAVKATEAHFRGVMERLRKNLQI